MTDEFEVTPLAPQQVVVTLKGGKGYEAPWLVVHGETLAQVGAIIEEARDSGALQVIQQAAAEFQAEAPRSHAEAIANLQNGGLGPTVIGQYGEGTIGNQYGGGQQLPGQYQPGASKYCPHGEMKFYPNGKFGPVYFCPLPKGTPGQCKPVSAR